MGEVQYPGDNPFLASVFARQPCDRIPKCQECRPVALRPTFSDGLPFSGFNWFGCRRSSAQTRWFTRPQSSASLVPEGAGGEIEMSPLVLIGKFLLLIQIITVGEEKEWLSWQEASAALQDQQHFCGCAEKSTFTIQ